MVDQSTEARLKDRKVLIVDDDAEVLESIKQALLAEGADTLTCGDGNAAVRLCETDQPQLVVLDMMLPKRSGFLVLEKIKRLDTPPRVIMVTANEGKRHQQYAEALERLFSIVQSVTQDFVDTPGRTPLDAVVELVKA